MDRSDTIIALTAALAKAQGEFTAAKKSRENPHLKNHYATLDDVINAIRAPLSKNGLAIIQPLTSHGDEYVQYVLETVLMHESGEWLSSSANIPPLDGNRAVNALQTLGSSLTYMRRYMLSALLGINTEDDVDGNGKDGKDGKKPARKKVAAKPKASPKKPTTTTPSGNGKPKAPSFNINVLGAVVEAGHADDMPTAARRLGKSQVLTRNDDTQAVVQWAGIYATHRAVGLEPTPAAARADAEWKAAIDGAGDGE